MSGTPKPSSPEPKFYIHTFGCQMNENDSEYIAGLLAGMGFRPSDVPDDAGVMIVNTCSVRAKSEDKLYSLLGRLAALKKKNGALLGVVGCSAQLHRAGIRKRSPGVDFIAGPDNYHRLADILKASLENTRLDVGRAALWSEPVPRVYLRTDGLSGLVTVMEGCDNFCSYCVVPFARGREKFRPWGNILAEIRGLAEAGSKEVRLLGQNVNSYRDPETGRDFAALLSEVCRVSGIEWVRFITSHPKSFAPELARVMAVLSPVCRQLHLPLQSGSTSVLQRMNRGYTRREYFDLVTMLRELMPDLSLSTDIIVGFPGETEKDFEETLTALEQARFTNIFSFRYSPRPLTAALKLGDDVPLAVKKRRLIEAQELQKKIQIEINRAAVGRVQKVLCFGRSKKPPRVFSGRNEASQVVNFDAPPSRADCVGRFVSVLITGCGPYSLRGELSP
jgi:tRNA-2-methylthio-N6-dimethylallyladenosine synthase